MKNKTDSTLLSDTDLYEAAGSWPTLNKLLPGLSRRQVASLLFNELSSGAPRTNIVTRLNQRLGRLDVDARADELKRVLQGLKTGVVLATILKTDGLAWLFVEQVEGR